MQREPIRIDEHGIRPPPAFSISDEAIEGAVVIRLEGELDMAASASLRNHVDSTAGRALVLDLRLVTFVDSSALRELLRARTEVEARGDRLVLAAIAPPLRRLFELTHTAALFETAPTREAALRMVGVLDD
jgi:stage II sporulation protein AA (anti-sigma F factor antagonist)